jgi:tetratricopeptide (TPR) repeat protein
MINYPSKSALIIEDFAEFARSLKAMLTDIGVEQVDLVNSGESAIRACHEKFYDIILSDYNLGNGKNGMQVLEELNFQKRLKPTAVFIMTTAENTSAMVLGAIENQPDAYLTKPFNNASLKSRLNKLLTKKEILSPILIAQNKGKFKEALEHCEKIAESYPKYKMAIQKLKAECYMQKRQYMEALQIYQNILEAREIPWAMVGLAQAQLALREYENAETTLKEAIQKFPMVLESYDLLAECQLKLQQKEEAQQTLQKAVKISPKIISRQTKLGEVALDNEDFDVSINAFKQTIRLGTNSLFKTPDSYINYINSVSKKLAVEEQNKSKQLIDEAENYLKDFYKEYKHNKICRLRGTVAEGNFCLSIGKHADAQKCTSMAKDIYQSLDTMLPAHAGLEIAQGLTNLGENALAEEIVKDAVQHNFDDAAFLEKAIPYLKDRSILDKGKEAHRLNSQGIKFFEAKEYEKAIDCFFKAVEASPKNISIILNTVQVLLKVHQSGNADDSVIDKCIEYLNSINTISPEDKRFQRFSELLRLTRMIQQENF